MTHALTRTSPFGERFVGRCDKCGQEGFGMGGALEPCPMDHLVSDEQALLDCLSRDVDPASADLPPTLPAARELPEVRAVQDALDALMDALDQFDGGRDGVLKVNARTALAAIRKAQEPTP